MGELRIIPGVIDVGDTTYHPRPRYDYRWNGPYAEFHMAAAEAACQMIRQGHSIRGAAGGIGLPYWSIVRWLNNSMFAHMVDVASAERVFTLEAMLLHTKDLIKYKVLMSALKRSAPEAWEETRVLPSDQAKQLPQQITTTVVEAVERSMVMPAGDKGVLN